MRRLALTVFAAGLVACHGSSPQPGLRAVRLAIHQDPIAFLPVSVAKTLGYDKEAGIVLETSEVAGGAKAIQALLGGSVDVAAASMADAVQLALEGRHVRGFLLLFTRPTAVLAVAPASSGSIRSVRDLKGRTVGVSAPGSATHQILNYLLVANGLTPGDVSTVSVGMSASSVAALEHGTVDAAVLLSSAIAAFERRQPHQTFLVDLRTAAATRQAFGSDVFPSVGLLAEEKWLQANPDTARRIALAITRGMQWVRGHSAEEVRDMLAAAVRTTPEADLYAIRQMQQVLSGDGLIPDGSMAVIEKFVAASNPKIRSTPVDFSRIYTNEFASAR
jgi:NitT/TauT family transport system substrate-binding protein